MATAKAEYLVLVHCVCSADGFSEAMAAAMTAEVAAVVAVSAGSANTNADGRCDMLAELTHTGCARFGLAAAITALCVEGDTASMAAQLSAEVEAHPQALTVVTATAVYGGHSFTFVCCFTRPDEGWAITWGPEPHMN